MSATGEWITNLDVVKGERPAMQSRIRTSLTVTKLIPALIAAKQAMGPLLKNKQNPHFRSHYADLAEVIGVSEGTLLENGIVPLQAPSYLGDRWVMVTRLTHVSGEWMEGDWPIDGVDAQKFGAASTYARRFGEGAVLNLAAEDDDGNAASGRNDNNARPAPAPKLAPKPAPNVMTPDQVTKLNIALREAGCTTDEARHKFCEGILDCPVATTKTLTPDEGQRCYVAALKAKLPEKAAPAKKTMTVEVGR